MASFKPVLCYTNTVHRSIQFNTYRAFCTKKDDSIFDESEQAAMADARLMVQSIDEAVVELKSYNDWATVVMKSKIPVIVD
jgi:hypothetical protein